MFPYDAALAAAVHTPPNSIADVLQTMETIDATCVDGDGLKWFNWLYLTVTQAVETEVNAIPDPLWLAELDVQFAALYFNALYGALSGGQCPGCWKAMFAARSQVKLARVQFALAGMNAHINHDLPLAIIATCKATDTVPEHGTPQYTGYTAIDSSLDDLIDTAKKTLHVRLLGDPLPVVSHLDDTIAGWNLAAAREQAWNVAESLWQDSSFAANILMGAIDGLTTVIGKGLLVPVP